MKFFKKKIFSIFLILIILSQLFLTDSTLCFSEVSESNNNFLHIHNLTTVHCHSDELHNENGEHDFWIAKDNCSSHNHPDDFQISSKCNDFKISKFNILHYNSFKIINNIVNLFLQTNKNFQIKNIDKKVYLSNILLHIKSIKLIC